MKKQIEQLIEKLKKQKSQTNSFIELLEAQKELEDKCPVLDQFNEGDEIKVQFNLRGREWNGPTGIKYFNTLEAWRKTERHYAIMRTLQFKVKELSLEAFLTKNLTRFDKDDFRSTCTGISGYHLMRDELLFKKDGDIKTGETVLFELSDVSQNSRKELTNLYTYKAEGYDDVSIKLKLIDFKIKTTK